MTPPSDTPAPFARIVACTDFSPNAEIAFRKAIELARPGAELILLHVIPEPEAQFWKTYIYEIDEDVDAKARRDIDAKIDELYRPLVPEGISLDVQVRIGRDYQAIIEFARERAADLLVLGHRGHGRLHEMFVGDVADKVVRHAPCAVLVVPLSRPAVQRRR